MSGQAQRLSLPWPKQEELRITEDPWWYLVRKNRLEQLIGGVWTVLYRDYSCLWLEERARFLLERGTTRSVRCDTK